MNHLHTYLFSETGLSESEIEVEFSEKFNRDTSDLVLERNIEKLWKEKLAKNSRLWNGSKFRLHAVNGKCLKLGLTGFIVKILRVSSGH